MIKIYIANQSKQTIGGGWTFIDNFTKGIKDKAEIVKIEEADIYLIPGATMVPRDEVEMVKEAGTKIVLRVDNIPRNSRNRNTGTSRLYDYAQMADLIIYQSWWANRFVGQFLDPYKRKPYQIIYNGVDTSIFNNKGKKIKPMGNPQYLYSRYNRDETKRWEEAWWNFQDRYFRVKRSHLWIVGQFSQELKEYNFDLFGGAEERYKYWGVIDSPEMMAKLYQGADSFLVPYFNDCCSNTILEAIACGCKIETLQSGRTGGTPEILDPKLDISLERMASEYLKEFEKLMAG